MIRRPRERFLQMLVYEHYVRPHLNFYEMAVAERRLMHAFDRELNGGSPNRHTAELVHSWFDKAWRRAEREWAEFRAVGDDPIYLPSPRESESSSDDQESSQLTLPPCKTGSGAISSERGQEPFSHLDDLSSGEEPCQDQDVSPQQVSSSMF